MRKGLYTILLIGMLGLVGCNDLFSNNDNNVENVVANDGNSEANSNSNEMEDGNKNEDNSAETIAITEDGEVIERETRSDYGHFIKEGQNLTIPDPINDSDIPILDDINVIYTAVTDEETRGLHGMTLMNYEYDGDFEDAANLYKDYFDNEGFEEVKRSEDHEVSLGALDVEDRGGKGLSRTGTRGDLECSISVLQEPDEDFVLVVINNYDPPAE